MADMEYLNSLSDEELMKIANGGSQPAVATPDPMADLQNKSDWELMEMTGDYAEYDYQLPSDKMYDEISGDNHRAEAEALYDKYANTPYSENSWKGAMYKGVLIPRPNYSLKAVLAQTGEALGKVSAPIAAARKILPDQGMMKNPVTVSAPQVAIDAVSDIPAEIAEFGAAGIDKAAQYFQWGDPGLTEKVQSFQEQNLPKMRVEGGANRFVKEAAPYAVGGLGVTKVMKNAPALSKAIGTMIAGAIARDDKDTDTILFGENSLLGSDLSPLTPEERDAAGQVLSNRLNLLLDDIVVGTMAEAGIKGTVWATKTLYGVLPGRMLPFFNKNKRALKVMEHVASMLRLADGAGDKREQADILRNLAAYMADPDNQKIIREIPNDQIEDIAVRLDSMSILRRASDDVVSDVTKDNAAILARKGDQAGGIAEAADKMTSQTMDAIGRDKPEQAKSVIDDIVETKVGSAKSAVGDVERDIELVRQNLKQRLTNDPTFGEAMQKAGKHFDILADDLDYKNTDRLTENVIDAFLQARENLDGLSKKVSGNIALPNKARMQELIKSASDNSNVNKGVLSRLNKAGNSAVSWAMEVRPMLSAEISRLRKQGFGSGADADYLMAIRSEIDSQLDTLANSDGVRKSAVGKAFQDFHSYFKEKYAPVWTEGILGDAAAELKDSALVRFGRKSSNTLSNIDDAIADKLPNFRFGPEFVTNMRQAGMNTNDIKDYVVGKAIIQLRKKIKPGANIEDIPINVLSEELTQYGAMFKEADPQLADSINSFLRQAQSDVNDIGVLKEMFKEAESRALKIEDGLKGAGGTFGDFYRTAKSGTDLEKRYAVVDDASEAIQNMYKDQKGSISKINDIISETSINGKPDPNVMAGLQVAWVDSLRREMIDKSTGAFNVKGSKLLLDDDTVTSFLNLGEMVFKDKPELFELHKQILSDALHENMTISKQLKSAMNSKSVDTDIANAAHILTTWTFGVLNRTAARLRSGVGGVLAVNKKAGSVDQIYQQLLNDPKFFSESLNRLADSISLRGAMSKETKEVLWDVMTRVGPPGEVNPEDPGDRKLFQEVLREVQTEMALIDGRGATKARKERRDSR